MPLKTQKDVREVRSFIAKHHPDMADICTLVILPFQYKKHNLDGRTVVLPYFTWSGQVNQVQTESERFYNSSYPNIFCYDVQNNIFIRDGIQKWLYQFPQRARLCAMWHQPTANTVIDRLPWDIVKMIGQYI